MATKIFLPRLGESITEAVIGKWLKQPGEPVARGEVIAELETAKAMMELESPAKERFGDLCQTWGYCPFGKADRSCRFTR
jgi:hypothetical protein